MLRGARQKGGVLVDLSGGAPPPPPPPPGAPPPGALDDRLEGKFWLSPTEVAALMAEASVDEDALLQRLITPAARLARPPNTSFRVG